MSIEFNESKNQFYLHTKKSSYIIELLDGRIPLHAYWGKTLKNMPPMGEWKSTQNATMTPMDTGMPWGQFANFGTLPLEYPVYGTGDMRETAFLAKYDNGSRTTRLECTCHKMIAGKPALSGLPATYGDESEVQTLVITLRDSLTGLEAELYYSVFEKYDAITRSVRFINKGEKALFINKAASMSVDIYGAGEMELLHLYGWWARERHIERTPLMEGIQKIDSKRGASGHHHNPFIALTEKKADETHGEVYGFSLVYSGSFEAGVELDFYRNARITLGINSFDFGWKLNPDEGFQTPEVVMVFSSEGLGKMSRCYHSLYRNNLCRGEYQYAERPVLVNNWEATYFDFNEEKLLAIAEKAKQLDIDMLVLDDGWFGKRNCDNSSLGDWVCNTEKIKGGLKGLGEKLNAMGMKFGLWFEPEMVSPDSDLYRAHPDWCIHAAGRSRSQTRNQLVLDLSRKDVCEYIIKSLSDVLNSAPISYVKWDYNRNFSEMGSAALTPECQQEQAHRYILGLYNILEELNKRFPDVLFEGCSGGGGRFDPGMLYYMPQIWCSDDTDAVERIFIQYGTSIVYPAVTISAHVSACPNHQVGRTTPFKMRGDVAMSGQFGYEMDLSALSDEDLVSAKEQVAFYKKYRNVVQYGDMYRLVSPYENDGEFAAWQFIKDKTAILYTFNIKGIPSAALRRVKMQGLLPDAVYREEGTGREYNGEFLMNVGVVCECNQDYISTVSVFTKQ